MNCEKISEYLIEYIDGKLEESTANVVKNHINDCPGCNKEYEEYLELDSQIKMKKEVQPVDELRVNFMQMIEEEKVIEQKKPASKVIRLNVPAKKIIWQTAAAIALLITGFLTGYQSNITDSGENVQAEQLAEMKNDVDEMKRMMVFNLLKNESASQRIKAVNYSEEISIPDDKIIDVLISTLNSDKSTNVRLAAVYSLARFKTKGKVKNAFIETLSRQDDPMIQIVIINMLVEMEEVKAVDEFQNLLKNKNINEQVKKQAELGVEILS